MKPEEVQDDLAFDTAFAEALGGASDGDEATEVVEAESSDDTGSDDQGAELATPPPSSGEEVAPPESSPAPASSPELDSLKAQIEELKKVAVPEKPQVSPEPTQAVEEEDSVFAQFEQDWPDVAKVMKARESKLKSEVQLVLESLNAVKQELLAKVQPLETQYQQSAADQFTNAVKSKHPDAFDLFPQVEEWAKTLPAHMRVGVDHVLSKGTVEDVVALYDDFKKATNRVAPVEPKVDEVTAQRMKRMAPVQATRTSVTGSAPDAQDFDGSFALAVQTMK